MMRIGVEENGQMVCAFTLTEWDLSQQKRKTFTWENGFCTHCDCYIRH